MGIETVCVVGAGNMGSGIAQACAQAGKTVHLVDQEPSIVEKGKQRMAQGLEKLVDRGKMTQEQVHETLRRIKTCADIEEAAQGIDLAIEAVFESYDAKGPIFAQLATHAPEAAILATNTSSLSVTKLAEHTDRPDRFVGLHFFFPAMINRLVEVVKGDTTSDETFEALMSFSRSIAKVPIETRDKPGFCVNRFFVPYLNEACRLLEEDVADIPTIDAAANELLGTPMGPFKLMNVTGPPITLHAQRTLHAELGPAYEPARILVEQIEGEKGAWDLEGDPDPKRFPAVQERLMGITIGIAAQLVEEGVATMEDTEKGATLGLAWPQGPFQTANKVGTGTVLAAVESLHAKYGDDFPVPELLRSHGAEDRPFALKSVSLHKEGPVARITLERPGQLNALNTTILTDLAEAVDAFARDDDLRVAVLTGEGRAFVSGADIKEMSAAGPEEARAFTELGQEVFRRIERTPKPVIAAVNGYAFGGGLELALACDMVYASRRAQLGLPEVTLGIIPGFGGTQRLPRRIGIGKARELVYTGRRFDAQEAEALGIVDRVYDDHELLPETMKVAKTIARNAPIAVSYAKRAMGDGVDASLDEGLELEVELAVATFGTDDQTEGMKAFAERRRPAFTGR